MARNPSMLFALFPRTRLSLNAAIAVFAAAMGFLSMPRLQSQTVLNPTIRRHASSRIAVGIGLGTLGPGIEVATPISSRLNLRGGVDIFSYNRDIEDNGITYAGSLSQRSVHVGVDWFPFRWSFHVSPGVMLYNGLRPSTKILIPADGGTSFRLNGHDYYSDPADPLTGMGKVTFPVAGPQVTVGFGSMIPRKESKHISVPFDVGFVYFGTGKTALNFTGSECKYSGVSLTKVCQNSATDTAFQTDVAAKTAQINKDLKDARIFPILRIGISYRF